MRNLGYLEKQIVLVLLLVMAAGAQAFTECDLSPNRVWVSNSGDTLWVCFDGGKCIYKTSGELSEKAIDRTLSMAMAAYIH